MTAATDIDPDWFTIRDEYVDSDISDTSPVVSFVHVLDMKPVIHGQLVKDLLVRRSQSRATMHDPIGSDQTPLLRFICHATLPAPKWATSQVLIYRQLVEDLSIGGLQGWPSSHDPRGSDRLLLLVTRQRAAPGCIDVVLPHVLVVHATPSAARGPAPCSARCRGSVSGSRGRRRRGWDSPRG